MKIYLGGVSGVGKTTIIRAFAVKHREYIALSGSEIIMEAYGLSDRSMIKNIVVEDTVLEKAYSKHSDLIIDGHFFIGRAEQNSIDVFIFVISDVDTISRRRILDRSRERSTSIVDIRREMFETFQRAKQSNVSPVFVLDNNENIDVTLNKLDSIILFALNLKRFDLAERQACIARSSVLTVDKMTLEQPTHFPTSNMVSAGYRVCCL